ncbi:Hypothetical predicted protein [Olea europaea subsp. europaea]|uniref:Uncharacterized protein n=1 Tax=Olea europaea subsp. europaea TaxID=158383 RepID=A0A8S0RNU0_OLEEU|nr:Hypothetical predicted protein [Olea europaea subsp. europaea]
MFSKGDDRKKIVENSGNGNFLNDLQTISNALYTNKMWETTATSTVSSRSKFVGKFDSTEHEIKREESNKNIKDSFEEKKSIWSWKSLKALTNARNRRFNCCFSLQVHCIEGLQEFFNDASLVVHWKRKDGELMTQPVRVYKGIAKFEEQLTYSCPIYGTKNGPNRSAKYEAKHFSLYASVYNAPELDLGKHLVDLTRLLPLTLEELEEEKSSGKWTTSFRLSGNTRGASMNVSFGYMVVGNKKSGPSSNSSFSGNQSLRQNSANVPKLLGQFDQENELGIQRAGSYPAMSSISCQSSEYIKDLHEILPTSKSKLCGSVNIVYQKFDEDMSNVSVRHKLESDSFTAPDEPLNEDSVDAVKESLETEHDSKFSVIEEGFEELTKKEVKSQDESLKVAECSAADIHVTDSTIEIPVDEDANLPPLVVETGCDCEFSVTEEGAEAITKEQVKSQGDSLKVAEGSTAEIHGTDSTIEIPVDEDATLHNLVVEISCQKDESSFNDCNSEENKVCPTELLMKELETALICASDLVEELDSQEDETDALCTEDHLDIKSCHRDQEEEKSLSLDDVTEAVASEFLDMLGSENSPFRFSSESEPHSPREHLLRQFEKEVLASGSSLFNFDMDNYSAEVVGDVQMCSGWGNVSGDFHHSSTVVDYEEMAKMETDAMRSKTRASVLEGLESEALMREWGLNEKAFQSSSPSSLGGFGIPIDMPPEEPPRLPPLAEGLGPFVETKNGGFLQSTSPALFRNSKSGGSLIMQVSSPVVVPAEMGSGVMEILQSLASVGIKKLSMQANKLMPLEDINGKTMQQIAWEAAPLLEEPKRQRLLQNESETMQNIPGEQKRVKGKTSGPRSGKLISSSIDSGTLYVSLEDLAPLAMDKIEALSIEGLRIQSGMSDEDGPSNISLHSNGEFSALKGKAVNFGGSIGLERTGGLQLLDVKDNGEDLDGLMGLSLPLDKWMRLDSGEIDDEDLSNERMNKILAAHHATSVDLFRGRSKLEKRRAKGRKWGLLGNNFTVALMVQLHDPLRNYDPVGTPMLALIQVERVFVPLKPKIFGIVSQVRNYEEEEEEPKAAEKIMIEAEKEEEIHEELIPQYKVTQVHVAGLKTEPGKKMKLWGSKNQQNSGSRWLLANGMGKKDKHPMMKSNSVAKSAAPASSSMTTTVQPGDTLWSISSRVHGTGAKWKELAALNPHIRNPNVIFPNESVRLR